MTQLKAKKKKTYFKIKPSYNFRKQAVTQQKWVLTLFHKCNI